MFGFWFCESLNCMKTFCIEVVNVWFFSRHHNEQVNGSVPHLSQVSLPSQQADPQSSPSLEARSNHQLCWRLLIMLMCFLYLRRVCPGDGTLCFRLIGRAHWTRSVLIEGLSTILMDNRVITCLFIEMSF